MTAPAWLVQRGGSLKIGSDSKTWYVLLNEQLSYSLVAVPVGHLFGCTIRQTSNGKRLDNKTTYPSAQLAIEGGIVDLGKELGWA